MYNFHIDLQTSCTKDEAIALLIGLGDMRRLISVDEDATPEEIDASSFSFCLEEYLYEEHDSLECDYKVAVHEKLSEEEITEKLVYLNEFKELTRRAREYLCHFDNEIAKGELSAIRIHKPDSSYVKHYTLISINQWAETEFGIKSLCSKFGLVESNVQVGGAKFQQRRKAIMDQIKALGHNPKSLPKSENGKPWIKSEVRKALAKNPLFKDPGIFDRVWQKMRELKDLVEIQ